MGVSKKLTEKQYTRFLGAQGLQQGKGSVVFSKNQNRILSKIRSGEISGKRAEVLITTGEDIGAAANAMDIKSALLLGAIQESQRQFNRTSADPFVSDFDRLSKTQQDFALQDRPFDELRYLDLTKKEEEELRAKLRQSTNRSTQPDPYSIFTKRVSDVQRVNMGSIGTFQDALENQRRSVSGIRGIGGRADKAIALEQARRQIEDNITITRNQKFIDEMKERDRLATLRRFGGYSSRKEFIQAGKRKQSEAFIQAQRFMFGFGFTGIKRYTGMSDLRGQLGIIARQANERRTALESAGLGYKSFNINGLRYRHTRAEYYAHERERQSVVAFNNNQYAKAKQINILQQDFGVSGFTGSALTLPSLQDEVAKQDALIKSIGLDRTEAFQIVDTAGRGREEIDDRIRFKDRMNSMSTGVSVL